MERPRIAICGGGIASLCLAHVLCQRGEFEVQIFEGSTVFREDGQAVGLALNAQSALQMCSPVLRQALDEAGGTQMNPSTRLMMGTGPDSGKHIGDIQPSKPKIVVHRGPFIRELRRHVPADVLHMGKRLKEVKVSDEEGPVELHFEDGTVYTADALIGCDGINSITRTVVLGEDHPAARPVYGPGYVHRVVIPLAEAKSAFGEEYCSLQTQHGWIGKDGFLLTDLVDHATAMQVIAGWITHETWPHQAPFVEWSKERLMSDLQDWGDIGKAMRKVFTSQPKLYAAGPRTHLETPTFCKGQICIAGDAAQSFPPFRGAGVGQAIEDALMLSTLLLSIPPTTSNSSSSSTIQEDRRDSKATRTNIRKAFTIYDALRRPRRLETARLSLETAVVYTGRDPVLGLDMARIAATLPGFGAEIEEYDLVAVQNEALRRMQSVEEN